MKRVLVLDDEPSVLDFISKSLKGPDIEVIACLELEAAETVLDHFTVDTLVTDLTLSELGGWEGMRLIRYASTHFPETDVVIVTGSVGEEVCRLGQRLGARIVLQKPVELDDLRKKILPDCPPYSPMDGGLVYVDPLEKVLDSGTIRSLLQPIINLEAASDTPELYGVECLARGPHGSLLQNPELLFSYASKKEALFQTDFVCIRAALREAQDISLPIKIFINTHPRSMTHSDFATTFNRAVHESGHRIKDIVLELTEQQTIVNPSAFAKTLDKLREMGLKIALDDYGEGFANLHLLHELKPDYVKISGHFCRNVHKDATRQKIVRSTLALARDLDIPSIIEQVETAEELETLRWLGATYAQGYLFARPASRKQLCESGILQ